ncbi:MAG: hypothetical protein H6698_06795 [Myxococcales bacterium]|nr:hypothetical protein [Myxococcales bacterium]MCB9520993.1 hypothetical protein [Myxococcales bacterium]MCB9531680.1 hypothetical protein [Myxococcales bacterium]MCB9534015.1 hypothetical protein [Myxococcales bacterium]
MFNALRFASAGALALVLAAAPSAAFARDVEDELRDVLEEVNARLARLGTSEYADDAALEIGQAQLEIAEAQGKITAADYGWATIIINRVSARLELIESIEQRAEVDDIAQQRETELYSITQEADESQIELEQLQLRRGQLQDDVAEIVAAMNEGH